MHCCYNKFRECSRPFIWLLPAVHSPDRLEVPESTSIPAAQKLLSPHSDSGNIVAFRRRTVMMGLSCDPRSVQWNDFSRMIVGEACAGF